MTAPHKVLISGTGRAGTTLLVQVLGDLGCDTGAGALRVDDTAHAGLERDVLDPESAYIVKDRSSRRAWRASSTRARSSSTT